jgi:hypothetical protein
MAEAHARTERKVLRILDESYSKASSLMVERMDGMLVMGNSLIYLHHLAAENGF